MKEKLKDLKETHKPSLYIPVSEFFKSELNLRFILPKDVISTNSNFSSAILKEITYILIINFSVYSTKSRVNDAQLLKTKNEITHIENSMFDKENI